MSEARPRRIRKRFGQHFLSATWALKVAAAIDPMPGDVFMEIGPGRGAITLPLARSGAAILAVEIDRDLVAELAARAPANVTIISGDVLKTDVVPFLSGLEPQRPAGADPAATPRARRFRIVGNLPYNLSTPILFKMIEWQQRHGLFADATVMLQREVADRLVAKPRTKDYGVLTVLLGLHARITRLLDLPPGAFKPAPKVWSSVVRVEFGQTVRVADPVLFEQVVKRAFSQRRKTLSNALKSLVTDAPAVLQAAGIDPRRRPETLDLPELARLVEQVAAARRAAGP